MKTEVILQVAGNLPGKLEADIERHKCGGIEDGVAFRWPDEGWWLIPFTDIERLYNMAKTYREKN